MPHVRNGQEAKARRVLSAQERIEFYATEEGIIQREERQQLKEKEQREASKLREGWQKGWYKTIHRCEYGVIQYAPVPEGES